MENPQRELDVYLTIIDGKNVLTQYNKTYLLDKVGLSIWELCNGEQTLEEISQVIATKYHAPQEKVLADCRNFIADLQEKSLLE